MLHSIELMSFFFVLLHKRLIPALLDGLQTFFFLNKNVFKPFKFNSWFYLVCKMTWFQCIPSNKPGYINTYKPHIIIIRTHTREHTVIYYSLFSVQNIIDSASPFSAIALQIFFFSISAALVNATQHFVSTSGRLGYKGLWGTGLLLWDICSCLASSISCPPGTAVVQSKTFIPAMQNVCLMGSAWQSGQILHNL